MMRAFEKETSAMSDPAPQTYANHRRFVPGFHFVAFGLLAVCLLWRLYRAIFAFSADNLFAFLFAAAVLLIAFYARLFALCVQDRVIRLEERLRLERLLPPDLKAAAAGLTPGQLIGLRFASDAELPELVRGVLADGVTDRETIKKRVRDWRPDLLRA
jgi:Family of unknown function (DUF6526)